jgi:hypothetical protein
MLGTVNKATYLENYIEYIVATDLGKLFITMTNAVRNILPQTDAKVTLANHEVTLVKD